MRNLLIVGSGRSGTSMTAGALAGAGYFMGHQVLNRGRINNPFGNYEDREINYINEHLLGQVMPEPEVIQGLTYHKDRPRESQRWLGRLAVGTPVPLLHRFDARMRELTARKPFCFKDPRFSYTLPAWRPYLGDAAFVCVFREPFKTVSSMLRQIRDAPHLRGLELDYVGALEVWKLMYGHILETHRHQGSWLFLHYDQLLTPEGLDRLEEFTGARVDRDFPRRDLRRTYAETEIPEDVRRMYAELCGLAGFHAV
jgi:hypothetical protein